MQYIRGGLGADGYNESDANVSMGNNNTEGCPPTAYFMAMAQVLKERALKMGGKPTPPDQVGKGLMPGPATQDPTA